MQQLINEINKISGIDICEKNRKSKYVFRRALFVYLCRIYNPELSYEKIGKMLGGYDHATMLFAFKNYEIYRKHDKSLIDLEKKLVQNFSVIKPKKYNEIDNLNYTIDLLRSRISELEMLISKQNTIGQRIDNLIENSNNPEILIERLNAIIKMNK
jgi:hypothetical protein